MKSKLKILMLEDERDDAELIGRSMIKSGMSFVSKRVDTKHDFSEALSHFSPDVILSDLLYLIQFTRSIKGVQAKRPFDTFILVTGTVSEEFALPV